MEHVEPNSLSIQRFHHLNKPRINRFSIRNGNQVLGANWLMSSRSKKQHLTLDSLLQNVIYCETPR